MKYTQNTINILTALQYKGIGAGWIVSKWEKGITDKNIVCLLNQSLKGIFTTENEFNAIRQVVLQKLNMQAEWMDGIVGWLDEDFPFCRGVLRKSDYPVSLFYKGNISLLKSTYRNVAVIGVLKPEESIINREKIMVSTLLRHDYVIVSGLALGCDSIAHIQTLEECGKTIAVLPSTLQNILPSQHKQLAEQIVKKGGLLVTEYLDEPMSQLEMRGRYQKRDRLQAMFSDAIILTASYDINTDGNDSGSRLAMEYARQYNIARYVMYNEVTDSSNPQFALNQKILRDGNAQILTQQKIPHLIQSRNSQQLALF